jgi:hypothetical protein
MVRVLATGLIVALPLASVPVSASDTSATLIGSIVSAGDQTPLSGARLHVGDPRTGEIFSSQPVGDEGTFLVDNLPPAIYELAVESNGGLYVTDTPLQLQPGQSRTVNLAVNPQQEPAPGPQTAEDKKKKKAGVWNNPLTATLIVLGSALVIGIIIEAADDDDDGPSPSPSS